MATADVFYFNADNSELSLLVRKGIKDSAEGQKKIQSKIEEIVGGPVTWGFEGDLEAFKNDLGKNLNDIGAIIKNYCGGVRDLVVRDCKDSMIKEEFVKKFSARKIVFKFDQNRKDMYPQVEMADGCLKIVFAPKYFHLGPSYVTNQSNQLAKVL